MLPGQLFQPGFLGQAHHRDQPNRRHQIRIVEHRRDPAKSMRESHPRDALPRAGRFELSQVPISQPVRAFSPYGTLNPLPSTDPIGGSGLRRSVASKLDRNRLSTSLGSGRLGLGAAVGVDAAQFGGLDKPRRFFAPAADLLC